MSTAYPIEKNDITKPTEGEAEGSVILFHMAGEEVDVAYMEKLLEGTEIILKRKGDDKKLDELKQRNKIMKTYFPDAIKKYKPLLDQIKNSPVYESLKQAQYLVLYANALKEDINIANISKIYRENFLTKKNHEALSRLESQIMLSIPTAIDMFNSKEGISNTQLEV